MPKTSESRTKSRIVFIKVPDFLFQPSPEEGGGAYDEMEDSLDPRDVLRLIDPDIPLPVELLAGAESLNSEDISVEMILSGVLCLLAAEPEHEYAAYYRYVVLSVRPGILDELTYAAMMKAENGDFDMAIEILDILKGLFPNSSELLASKDIILQKKKAEGAFEISGTSGDALFTAAYHDISADNIDEGLHKIRAFLEKNPRVWNAWFLLGWGLRRALRYGDAEAAFRKAMEEGGTTAEICNELAICLMEQGDLKAARKELETALRSEPENVKIISNLGVLALKTGNEIEAAGFFRTVLEIDPNDMIAKEYLGGI
jgi:tetratricopeptide (TPR) repeat protein